MKRVIGSVLAAICLVLLTERDAHAYIDPAAGSLLLQLVLGGVAGLVFIVKMYWRRVRSFVFRSEKPGQPS